MSENITNRFKKSIIDAENNTQSITNNELNETPKENFENVVQVVDDKKEIDIEINDISKNILSKILSDDVKNKGSNHTLYLSYDVGNELKKISKKTNKSKSQIVDEILSMVFFQKD